MATSKSPVITVSSPPPVPVREIVYRILLMISFCHLLAIHNKVVYVACYWLSYVLLADDKS